MLVEIFFLFQATSKQLGISKSKYLNQLQENDHESIFVYFLFEYFRKSIKQSFYVFPSH